MPSVSNQGVSHTPSEGVNTPQLSHNTPRLQGKMRERGEGRKGKGEEKGRDLQGLVDTPMFQILKNINQKSIRKD